MLTASNRTDDMKGRQLEMAEFLLVPLRLVNQMIILETTLLGEMVSIFFPTQDNCSQVMEECGIWTYGEIPIDISL